MKNPSLSPSLLLVGVAALTASLAANISIAQSAVPDGVQRELNIMENIFSAATTDRNHRGSRMGPPESIYLPGQGMLFIFNLPGGFPGSFNLSPESFNFSFNGNVFDYDSDDDGDNKPAPSARRATAAAPAAPATPKTGNGSKASTDTAMNYRDKLQDLNEQMRDKESDMRDLQRKMRDMQRDLRNDASKNNQSEMDKVYKSMQVLGEEMGRLGTNITEMQKQSQQERNAAAEARGKEQSNMIFDTLCKYGNTLQSLKSGEHVDLVLRNFAGGKTRVFVLDAAKLTGCSSGEKLQQEAKSYSM